MSNVPQFIGPFTFLPNENPQRFHDIFDALHAEHDPKTPTEALLVHGLARHSFLVERALRLQDDCLMSANFDDKKLNTLIRYQTTQQRAFHKCLSDLLKLQKQRKKDVIEAEERHRAKWNRSYGDRVREGDLEAIQIELELGMKPEKLPYHIKKMLGYIPQNPLNLNLKKVA